MRRNVIIHRRTVERDFSGTSFFKPVLMNLIKP